MPARSEELDLNLLSVLNNKCDQGHTKQRRNHDSGPHGASRVWRSSAADGLGLLCLGDWLFDSWDTCGNHRSFPSRLHFLHGSHS